MNNIRTLKWVSDINAGAILSVLGVNAIAGAVGFSGVVQLHYISVAIVAATILTGFIVTRRTIKKMSAVCSVMKDKTSYDSLTGLFNRDIFTSEVQSLLDDPKCEPFAVLMLDLDGFKAVNDNLGHAAGDSLLKQFATRLRVSLRSSDFAARLSGDEFAVVLHNANVDDARNMAARVLKSIARSFVVEDEHVTVGVSVGIALFPEHGSAVTDLLKGADAAMYAAKRDRAGFSVYLSGETDMNIADRLMLLNDLKLAINNEDAALRLVYQPKINTVTKDIVGVEALLRWEHPTLGNIPPEKFVRLAERSGIINLLTKRVIDMSLSQYMQWANNGLKMPMSINISADNLHDMTCLQCISNSLIQYNVDPHDITLEVTETSVLDDHELMIRVLIGLSALGIRLSIDDFGTGHSSFVYLKHLPVNEIKIDRMFIMDLLGDKHDAKIVQSTIDLAHDIGCKVVAEGIETREILGELELMGCDVVQGYYISEPLEPGKLLEWCKK